MSSNPRLRLPPHALPPGNAPLVSAFNSLRFRLLLMLAVVTVVTIGIAALVGGWAIINQFESYVQEGGTMSVRCFDVAVANGTRIGAEVFIRSVNRTLLTAIVAAGGIAVILTLTFTRRILGPVSALTKAVRRMEAGDLRQRVKVESTDELGALAHAFNAMADGLARTEQLRRQLVTDVAHELCTPLTNIRGYIEALQDGVADPSPAVLDSIHEEAMLLNRLVEDLQELALVEAGQLKLVFQPVAPNELVQRAVASVQPAAAAKQITIMADLPEALPPVYADRERVGQVLRNLLDNAITHTAAEGEIVVSARVSGPELEVSVRDTGAGIAYQDLPNVFDRFYRADRSRARATGGFGLGLAIVKQLVEAHGGRVWVRSTVGIGSTFLFTLPIVISPAPAVETAVAVELPT